MQQKYCDHDLFVDVPKKWNKTQSSYQHQYWLCTLIAAFIPYPGLIDKLEYGHDCYF